MWPRRGAAGVDTQPPTHADNRPIEVGIQTIKQPQVRLERTPTCVPRNVRSNIQQHGQQDIIGTEETGHVVLWSSYGPLLMRAYFVPETGAMCVSGSYDLFQQQPRDTCERRAPGSNPRPQQEGNKTPVVGDGDANAQHTRYHDGDRAARD